MPKRFMFVCLGILCLAIAYHLGANSANAQAATTVKVQAIAASGDKAWVVTESDEIYLIDSAKTASVAHGEGWAKYRLGVLH